jgi:hypothetical protein
MTKGEQTRRKIVEAAAPIFNADDGNTVLRVRVAKALRSWLGRVRAIVKALRRIQSHPDLYLESEVAAAR